MKTEPCRKNIILIGPPNTGKTTLFNWLTGFNHRIINYPGSTVLLSLGNILEKYNLSGSVTDTPGIYSLFHQSEDEKTTVQSLFENKNNSVIVLVLDAGKLELQLTLFFQLKEAGFSPIIALTMWDTLHKYSLINIPTLEKLLKSPVVPIKGLIGEGIFKLTQKITSFTIDDSRKVLKKIKPWDQEKFNKILDQSKNIVKESYKKKNTEQIGKKENIFYSNKWDRFFLHPQKGFILFTCIMFAFFSSIFWMAEPFMSAIDQVFSFLIEQSRQRLSLYPKTANFVSHGILASFGSVLVFVPQIFILFIGISLLEDSGYLSRAVALMDGPFSKIGLSGRSFVPFLSGYACAIPSILLARNLKSKREKLITLFSIPFMSCSARLPVYALLLSFLFYGQSSWKPGLFLSLIYIASFFLGLGSAFLLNIFLKKEEKGIFLLDLPLYRKPVWKKIFQNAVKRTQHYIVKAGPAIFTVALVIWALSHFPLQPELSPSEQIQNSYAGQIGQFVEPLFGFMGVDWRVGAALIAAFAAREVFVSALVLIFSITTVYQETLSHSLIETMKTASYHDGSLVFTTASVSALIVFFMFSLQCLSTTALIYKETSSLKLAVAQFLSLNVLAYFMAVLTYQTLNWVL